MDTALCYGSEQDRRRIGTYLLGLPLQRAKLDDDGCAVRAEDGAPVMVGVQYRVRIEELKSKRSLAQNARMWALMTALSKQAPPHMDGVWYSPEVWYRHFEARFLGVEPGPFGAPVPKHASKLGVGAFCDWMTEVEAWVHEEFPGFEFNYEDEP